MSRSGSREALMRLEDQEREAVRKYFRLRKQIEMEEAELERQLKRRNVIIFRI